MSRIAMLLSNAYRPDPRVQREAQALIQAGYSLDLYCWDRHGELAAQESRSGLAIHRFQAVPSRYAAGWQQIFRLPRYWGWAIKQVSHQPAEIIHCHDLDTLYAGVALKRHTKCKLIFDAHEHYPTQMSLYLPKTFVWMLGAWERIGIRYADQIITASQVLADDYRRRTACPVTVIGNAPSLKDFEAVTEGQIQAVRQQIGLAPDQPGLFYIGGFTNNRAFAPLFEALTGTPGWQLHLWGDGPQRQLIETAASRLENVHYHGWAAMDRLPALFAAADAIYYGLRTDYPGAKYNAPNSLAYAMAAARPVIANRVGDLGRIVAENECGVLLHEIQPDYLRDALQRLADPQTRRRLGDHGRKAAETHYNWEVISQSLVELCAGLTR